MMSWHVSHRGTKAEMLVAIPEQFDAAGTYYTSTPQGADIRACRDRAIALVQAFTNDDLAPSTTAPKGYVIEVKAGGSHAAGSASFNLSVSKIAVE